jgi:glycosyltransferase involved in cell wall biosynthesis
MRVLLVHNFYRSSAPSGEDEVVRGEHRLLMENGFEVIPFTRHNDNLRPGAMGALDAAFSNAWSFSSVRALRRLIAEQRPDIAHFHNTFPQISPAAYLACRDAGVPVVQTLHNYRMFCANALLNRGGAACESCLGRAPLPALLHGCYRDSRVATAGMLIGSALHRARRTYQTQVDRYIVLTEFARQRFLAHGIPADRLVVRGNSLPHDPGLGLGGGGYALYVGRLTAEKGVATLIRAWRRTSDIPLRIVGDGELRAGLEREACDLPIEFLGRVTPERVLALMKGAEMLVVPSECYEGFPRVVVEAFATGTPIVAADLGGLGELVDERAGIKFRSGDANALANAVTQLWKSPALRENLRRANRRRFEREYSPTMALASLHSVYRDAAGLNDARLAPAALR